ncbi:MAG TPA: protein phosphatase 2C domain-containing protein [Longimicrobium sp.]
MIPYAVGRAVHAEAYGHTHPGQRRRENQDSFLIADLGAPVDEGPWRVGTDGDEPARRFTLGEHGLLAVVADGMGGAAAGALASRLAVASIYAALSNRWTASRDGSPARFAALLREALEDANGAIHRHARRDPACDGMGTTATAAGVLDGCAFLAQVGDSRAYLVRGGRAAQLTRDQSLVQQLMDRGALTAEEAERSGQASVLLQALGPRPDVTVDLTWQQLRRGDVLVLCSDGLFRAVAPDEIAAAAARWHDTADLCRVLVDAANDRGGPDNVTVLAIRVDGAGLDVPQPGDTVGWAPYHPG